jgi:hypothetical protein
MQQNFRRALGGFHLHIGQGDEAVAVFEGIIRQWPKDIWGHIALAEAFSHIYPPRQAAVPLDVERATHCLEQAKAVADAPQDREVVEARMEELRRLAGGRDVPGCAGGA